MPPKKSQSGEQIVFEMPKAVGTVREVFLQRATDTAKKQAEEIWRKANPDVRPSKGGRPSEAPYIYEACDKVWATHRKPLTIGKFIKEIEKILGSQGRSPHTDTIHRHLEEWMGELDIREVRKRFADSSSIKIRAKKMFIEMQIYKDIIGPWAIKNGIKTVGEILKIEKQGFPPSLQKKIQKARLQYLSS
ncbi:MAG: hypothetical protein KC643_29545 [Nitrospira sp.]|nr:hypothetical protein [Nitrospira sp.]